MTKYSSCLIISLDKKKALLIRKNRPEFQKGRLNIIGGHIESGEYPKDAVIREVFEESGLVVDPENIRLFCTLRDYAQMGYVYFYITYMDFTKAETTTDEDLEIVKVGDLPESALDNLEWLIPLGMDTADNCAVVSCGKQPT